MLSWLADGLQILSASENWKVSLILILLSITGYVIFSGLRQYREELKQVNLALVRNGKPVDILGGMTELLQQRMELFDKILAQLKHCGENQAACVALHEQFFKKPDLLCSLFADCPANQDSRARSVEAHERMTRMETMLTEFLQNTGVQVLRLAEIASGAVEHDRRRTNKN